MKNYKNFLKKINENINIIEIGDIHIEKFENEISENDLINDKNKIINLIFDVHEVIKLNLFFGVYYEDVVGYGFKTKFKTFGGTNIHFDGFITKNAYIFNDKIVNGKRNITINDKDIFYIIEGEIIVKIGVNIGMKNVHLKFNTINNLINFVKDFQHKIKYSIEF